MVLTNESKDISNCGNEDHKNVGEDQKSHRNSTVAQPTEFFLSAQQLGDGTADLENRWMPLNHKKKLFRAHWK